MVKNALIFYIPDQYFSSTSNLFVLLWWDILKLLKKKKDEILNCSCITTFKDFVLIIVGTILVLKPQRACHFIAAQSVIPHQAKTLLADSGRWGICCCLPAVDIWSVYFPAVDIYQSLIVLTGILKIEATFCFLQVFWTQIISKRYYYCTIIY